MRWSIDADPLVVLHAKPKLISISITWLLCYNYVKVIREITQVLRMHIQVNLVAFGEFNKSLP